MQTADFEITAADLANLMRGEGGSDLERIVEGGRQVAMRIVGIQPGTTAAKLGARTGDTIESINDIPLVSVAEAYRAADVAAKQAKIVIRGSSDGKPYTTTLTLKR
ncbi:MAG TPA: hypothetical protein VGC41_22415 [Kofleriaceae bacterium]